MGFCQGQGLQHKRPRGKYRYKCSARDGCSSHSDTSTSMRDGSIDYNVAGYRARQHATLSVYAAKTNCEQSGSKHFYRRVHVQKKNASKKRRRIIGWTGLCLGKRLKLGISGSWSWRYLGWQLAFVLLLFCYKREKYRVLFSIVKFYKVELSRIKLES